MRYRLTLIAIITGLAVLVAGCHWGKETDEVAFITAMGIDKAENDKIKVTYRIMIPRAVGGAQGGGQELPGGPGIMNTIVAANTAEAHNLLSTIMSRYANLAHMKSILISEEVARSGVGDLIAPLVRYREYRGSIFIHVVKGTAADYLAKNKPKIDYLTVKSAETFMRTADESSYYVRADVHDFYIRLKNPGGSPYANYIGINPLTGEDKPVGEKLPNDKADAYLPGGIPRTAAESPIEHIGAAVFAGDKMVGALDTKETRILALLQNKFPHGFFIIDDLLQAKKPVNINLRNGSKPEISVDLVDGREVIKIKVLLEGEITSIPSGVNYEKGEYHQRLEAEVSNLVKQQMEGFIQHTQELGSDVFGFGYYLRPKFATYSEMRKANLTALYKTAEAEVEVTTKIRRTGLMWRTSPYKPE